MSYLCFMYDNLYMQRCLQLAKNGLGSTYPNPMVGAVIVYNNQIIGEGWHHQAGEPHAEVMAINQVKEKELLSKSTIYVSLEPCSHFGKTPPCCDLILAKNIPRIVVGCIDPFAMVSGNGIKKLKNEGKEVIVGVLEKECLALNKRFFTFHQKKRPYILLKWAETADGYIAPLYKEENKVYWISNQKAKQLVHKWRSEEQSILVGHQTVLQDNPSLTTREWSGKIPTRIVLSRDLKPNKDFEIFNDKAQTLVFDLDDSLKNLMTKLYHKNIQSIIVEGGKATLEKFINENIWDEARIFQSKDYLYQGIKRPSINGQIFKIENIGDNTLTYLKP